MIFDSTTYIPNSFSWDKVCIPLLGALLCFPAFAQSVGILADFTADTASLHSAHPQSSENSIGTQVEKKVGKTFKGKVHPTRRRANSWLTALYLRPAEPQITPTSAGPMVPALMLEGTPSQGISTTKGLRQVRQLRKGDILYHYEASTQRVSAWEVRIVHRKARRTDVPPSFATTQAGTLRVGRMLARKE